MLTEIILTSLLIFIIWNITKKPSDYPPGAWGLPVIGSIPLGKRNFVDNIEKLKEKYGKIFCWKIGSKLLIFVNDYQAIKETFQTFEYADRPQMTFLTVLINEFDLGKRFRFDDKLVLEFDDLFVRFQNNLDRLLLVDIFPWLETILPKSIFESLTMIFYHRKLTKIMLKTFQEYVDEHKESLDENNPRDFIDDYLIEMEKQKSNPESAMSNQDLLGCIADLFAAGFQTTATATYWSIYYMSKFPETQAKLQKEIDEVLTNGRQVTLEDKSRLPYTDAFINETLRYSSQTPFHLPRTVAKDTKLLGYTIPKDSVILPAALALHYDNKHFDSPKEFRPERFLNSNGRFEFPKSGFFPFGTGKRQCIGESLARMELLIFLTTMVQSLHFSIPKGENLSIVPQDSPMFNFPRFDQNIVISVRN